MVFQPNDCNFFEKNETLDLSVALVAVPDVADLRAVLQVPAVRHLILPADVPGVLPQQTHLVVGVPRVP